MILIKEDIVNQIRLDNSEKKPNFIQKMCEEFGISAQTVYNWLKNNDVRLTTQTAQNLIKEIYGHASLF